MTYLHFVTLNTGAVERTASVDPSVTHPAAVDLARALRYGRSPIAGRAGYDLQAMRVRSALLCTIWRGELPLVSFGVAVRPRASAELWQTLHQAAQRMATNPESPPPVPWCGVRIEPTLMLDLAASAWLATYELEVAWAWIERRHGDA